mmetsp:Transcript_38109/g.80225  ORF Transcript_38109/g.80225 Transcript_38109/m.80225 type:complete len:605 (-) Transcript_38109:198-2012(-)
MNFFRATFIGALAASNPSGKAFADDGGDAVLLEEGVGKNSDGENEVAVDHGGERMLLSGSVKCKSQRGPAPPSDGEPPGFGHDPAVLVALMLDAACDDLEDYDGYPCTEAGTKCDVWCREDDGTDVGPWQKLDVDKTVQAGEWETQYEDDGRCSDALGTANFASGDWLWPNNCGSWATKIFTCDSIEFSGTCEGTLENGVSWNVGKFVDEGGIDFDVTVPFRFNAHQSVTISTNVGNKQFPNPMTCQPNLEVPGCEIGIHRDSTVVCKAALSSTLVFAELSLHAAVSHGLGSKNCGFLDTIDLDLKEYNRPDGDEDCDDVKLASEECESEDRYDQCLGPNPTQSPTCEKDKSGNCYGEPHFTTWSGEKYDFQGECDLVMLRNDDFMDGLGMHVHIRTKIRNIFSYVEAAAVKIGDDVFEVQGGMFKEHTYLVNGVKKDTLPSSFGGRFQIALSNGGRAEKFRDFYHIGVDDDGHDSITFKVKRMIGIHFERATSPNFGTSGGLMGDFETGLKLGRNGEVIEDANAFAMAWQVGPEDPVLLSPKTGSVQYPSKCKMPTTTSRHLRDGGINDEQARSICTGAEEFDHCVYDVVATNIADVANDYFD